MLVALFPPPKGSTLCLPLGRPRGDILIESVAGSWLWISLRLFIASLRAMHAVRKSGAQDLRLSSAFRCMYDLGPVLSLFWASSFSPIRTEIIHKVFPSSTLS